MIKQTLLLVGLGALASGAAWADDDAAGWGDASDWGHLPSEEPPKVHEVRIYGFIDAYWEALANAPEGIDDNGKTVMDGAGHEFDVPNLHLMVQGTIHDKYRYFLNLAGPGSGSATSDEPIAVRNAWVEAPVAGRYAIVRAGKTYRRFGLYNEILDAVPTFIGIEPPEIFDKDHLMLTRTTNLMVHGSAPIKSSTLHYAFTTGNDERTGGAVPFGGDVNLDIQGLVKVGTSFYTSGGPASPSRTVGEGAPQGGVATWMAEDRFNVLGGYAQVTTSNLTLQTEFWSARHNATRDEDAVLQLADAGLNPRQLERFFKAGDPSQGVSSLDVTYDVRTAYLRAGYQVAVGKKATLTPYLQADYYSNPEVIESKSFGGDAEGGLADDGTFFKYTAGVVARPVPEVALKIDGSAHQITFNDATVFYPEIRVSFSYLWQLANL